MPTTGWWPRGMSTSFASLRFCRDRRSAAAAWPLNVRIACRRLAESGGGMTTPCGLTTPGGVAMPWDSHGSPHGPVAAEAIDAWSPPPERSPRLSADSAMSDPPSCPPTTTMAGDIQESSWSRRSTPGAVQRLGSGVDRQPSGRAFDIDQHDLRPISSACRRDLVGTKAQSHARRSISGPRSNPATTGSSANGTLIVRSCCCPAETPRRPVKAPLRSGQALPPGAIDAHGSIDGHGNASSAVQRLPKCLPRDKGATSLEAPPAALAKDSYLIQSVREAP